MYCLYVSRISTERLLWSGIRIREVLVRVCSINQIIRDKSNWIEQCKYLLFHCRCHGFLCRW